MSHEAEAGPSSRPASPSPLSYLDDSPNFDSSLRMYSRLHSQTIERVREEHEREYRGGGGSRGPLSNRTPAHDDDIDYGDHPSPPDVLSSSDEGDSESQWSITTSQFEREQEEQWKEAMDQLQLAVQIIICPLLGKYMGRRWAYWAFSRYQLHGGLSFKFFGISWVPDTIIPSWIVAAWSLLPGGAAVV